MANFTFYGFYYPFYTLALGVHEIMEKANFTNWETQPSFNLKIKYFRIVTKNTL